MVSCLEESRDFDYSVFLIISIHDDKFHIRSANHIPNMRRNGIYRFASSLLTQTNQL